MSSGSGTSFQNSYTTPFQNSILPAPYPSSLGGNIWDYESSNISKNYAPNLKGGKRKNKGGKCGCGFGGSSGGKKSRKYKNKKQRKTKKTKTMKKW